MKNFIKIALIGSIMAFTSCSNSEPDTTQIPDQGIPKRDGGATPQDSGAVNTESSSVGTTELNSHSSDAMRSNSVPATPAH